MSLFHHPLVPVADADDAAATADALRPHLDAVERLTVVHIVQKAGGAVDKAPLAKRRADATRFLSTLETRLEDHEVAVETAVTFGTDVAETVVQTATDVDATAVAFRPRGGSRLVRWLSGDTAVRLVSNPELPVVALPTSGPDRTVEATRGSAERTEVS